MQPSVNLNDFLSPGTAPKSNVASIVSLVCGVLGCVGITAIVAIICGIIGIKNANRPEFAGKGKGMALAGLILGVVFLGVWGMGLAGGAAGFLMAVKGTEAPRNQAKAFVQELANNDIDAAIKRVDPESTLTSDVLQDISDAMDQPPEETDGPSDWGRFKDLSGTNISINSTNNVSIFSYSGTAEFDNCVKNFSITEEKRGDDWLITSFQLTN